MSKGIYSKVQEYIKGCHVQGCALENKNKIYISFENEGSACVTFYHHHLKSKWGTTRKNGYYRTTCCVVPSEDHAFVLVDWEGAVLAQHGLKKGMSDPTSLVPNFIKETPIPLLPNCPLANMRIIDGEAYVVGAWRTVFRRDGVDTWTCLHGNDAKEVEKLQKEAKGSAGFSDIGGFSKDEIYACGKGGDLWSYNAAKWKKIDAPTNKDMIALACTDTGMVYIACDDGTLLEGRGDSWKVLTDKAPADVLDIIWYQEKLYIACGMYGLYVYDTKSITTQKGIATLGESMGKEDSLSEGAKRALEADGLNKEDISLLNALSSVKMDNNIMMSPRKLATDGDTLLVSDNDRVAAFDGNEWKMLFVTYPSENGGELW